MRSDRRRFARSAALFLAIVMVAGWPWERVALAFSAAYSRVVDALLFDHVTFGAGGHAHLKPFPRRIGAAGDAVTADAELSLTLDRHAGALRVGASLRRDAWLPLVIVVAIGVAAPGAARTRLRRAAIGAAVVFAYSVAALWLAVLWMFAVQIRGVYALSDGARGIIDLANRALLLPPGNRFIVPLAVGFVLLWMRRTSSSSTAIVTDV